MKGILADEWERTDEVLEEDDMHTNFIDIKTVNKAYQKRIKVLSLKEPQEGDGKLFHCWIYPLKSKFLVRIPSDIEIYHPVLLKDFKILSGKIRIEPFNGSERKENDARAMIELAPDCDLETDYYHEKFFTLDLI